MTFRHLNTDQWRTTTPNKPMGTTNRKASKQHYGFRLCAESSYFEDKCGFSELSGTSSVQRDWSLVHESSSDFGFSGRVPRISGSWVLGFLGPRPGFSDFVFPSVIRSMLMLLGLASFCLA
jgi:hypothetical protein